MLIINLNSQLGNQMFQYALYRKLKTLGKHVKLDFRYYESHPEHYGLNIFDIHPHIATPKEITRVKDANRNYVARCRRKLFGKRQTMFSEIESHSLPFRAEIFNLTHAYIDGYWQTEKYFADIRPILLKEFAFPTVTDNQNRLIVERINATTSISLHIRRGDYIGGFPLMTPEYYHSAINYFQQKFENVCFFIFSNDMSWAKANINCHQSYFVDWNTGIDSWKDMYLMTQCRHNIIANSSFSWWGAWLNQHKDSEVVAPATWFYHQETPDIYCENWKIIEI